MACGLWLVLVLELELLSFSLIARHQAYHSQYHSQVYRYRAYQVAYKLDSSLETQSQFSPRFAAVKT